MGQVKKTLIIGGTASISDDIITYLEKNDYVIDLITYRTEEHKKNIENYEKYKWQRLNLLDQVVTENFIENLPNDYYDAVICFPTYDSGQRDPMATPRQFLEDLYGKFIINYMDLIRNLVFKKMKNDGQFVFISSEAANVPTDMQDYSAAKASMQAYVRSLSKKANEKTIFVIATTVIYESTAYYQHGGADYYSFDPHRYVYKEQMAKIIVEATPEDNGKIFTLGFIPTKTETLNVDGYAGIIYPYNNTVGAYNTWFKLIEPAKPGDPPRL